jgi:uncharacterized protein (UPF0303 family)
MKKTNWLLFSAFLFVLSCKEKSVSPQSEGTVFSRDFALCGCCGGFFIKINNDTMRCYKLPESSGIPENEPLPFRIKIDFQRDTAGCGKIMRNLITITHAERL